MEGGGDGVQCRLKTGEAALCDWKKERRRRRSASLSWREETAVYDDGLK